MGGRFFLGSVECVAWSGAGEGGAASSAGGGGRLSSSTLSRLLVRTGGGGGVSALAPAQQADYHRYVYYNRPQNQVPTVLTLG